MNRIPQMFETPSEICGQLNGPYPRVISAYFHCAGARGFNRGCSNM